MLAKLPLGGIQDGNLQQTSSTFSFDPLALLAVLHNARASASAARLYGQNNLGVFRWPHTSMYSDSYPYLIPPGHHFSRPLVTHLAI